MIGTRFSPGTVINEGRLLQALSEKHLDETEQQSRILENSQRCLKVQECLSCIAESLSPIPSVASELGVSVRSLQRVVSDATGYSPVYWRALARVRKAARQLQNATPLVEISVNAGFSDQSHMNREFQRWFGVSPSAFAETPGFLEQLQSPAYC